MCSRSILLAAILVVGNSFASNDNLDLQRTWDQGYLYLPIDGVVTAGRINEMEADLQINPPQTPVIIYMHGCSGIDKFSRATVNFLANNGYTVFMPDSYARTQKPVSCQPKIPKGGLHRAVLGWRQSEVHQAISKIRALPGGKERSLGMMGLSEGAITTATYAGQPLDARVIEGWTCHARWEEYKGLNAPHNEPVLSLVGDQDPWFTKDYLKGDCGEYMGGNSRPHQNSVVFTSPNPLSKHHYLLWNTKVKQKVLAFLKQYLN